MTQNVSITLQNTDEGRGIIAAIMADNPDAVANRYPAMTKIDCPGRLVMNRETISTELGRDYDLQELNLTLVCLSGNVDEDDDRLLIAWNA
ncbi:phenol hydroxylase component [Novosphingobium nitrogenifigens DSM 19370]|uniref:Phenol hydroxylase component n=1 Tax=Novosphingobium nitrogenifigens DSM 19370 TaxID=983920 RepID=F1ZC34_9SPHN|nr:MmoB/DmpM family protein [Novosphingobium nitrogenifigens]EGD57829.1 phenol hydroxylase component [Novosphingobium nitrogenifigens DSM 19370]